MILGILIVNVEFGKGFVLNSCQLAAPSTLRLERLQQHRHPLSNSFKGSIPLQSSTRIKHHHIGHLHQRKTPTTTRHTSTHLKAKSDDAPIDYTKVKPQVYQQRWVQLGILSLLALLSDWVCFSVAASSQTFETAYVGHDAATLIDIFLFTNVVSCFLVTDIVQKVGLEKAIKGASALMLAGCLLRSGFGNMIPSITAWAATTTASNPILNDSGLLPYPMIVAGTILVGASQPFFQCTPPMLSATWFAADERATSTAIALNFNQIGIATAFLVGGGMATDPTGLAKYFGLITVACAVVTAGTFWKFENEPPLPPSSSELDKLIRGEKEPPFFESAKKFFKTPGFSFPLAAFIMSIAITNIVGTFIDEVMCRGGIDEQLSVDLAGAGFEIGILVGGIIIGGYVDRTKKYKSVTLNCILATIFLLIPLGLTEHAIGKEPIFLVLALCGLGVITGPIQPINAELAVDVTYPSDETAVESVQQIGGNLVSALLLPLAAIGAKQDYQLLPSNELFASDIRGDVVMLMAIAAGTWVYFSGFDSPLKRTMADKDSAIDVDVVEDVVAGVALE